MTATGTATVAHPERPGPVAREGQPVAGPAGPAGLTRHPAEEVLAAFAAAVRAAGVPVTADRTQAFLRACALLGAGDPAGCYWAGRATLCADHDALERYDQVFAAFFAGGAAVRPANRPERSRRVLQAELVAADGGPDGAEEAERPVLAVAASAEDVLRHRDVAELSAAERAELALLFGRLHPRPPLRRSARRGPARHGPVDVRRTLRDELRRGGEPARLLHRNRSLRARRVVVLVDVSGSMAPYADALLRLAHRLVAASPARTEVFTIGTRLTRVTRALRQRDAEAALAAAGAVVPDWSGGTRLGESVRAFLDRYGQRGAARGAVVLVCSDGWERGDAALLGAQMRRLRRLAHRVVWVNPHRGKPGYRPVQGGIAAALPSIDDLLAGHSLATFERALEVVGRA